MPRSALLLIDVQHDYIERPDLSPPAGALLPRIARLLARCRAGDIAVAHVHTRVSPDGHDRMPHQQRRGIWSCVAGSHGAAAPAEAAPLAGEPVFHKTVFNAFSNPELTTWLRHNGIARLLIAGVHTHACVREAAMAAYQLGTQEVIVIDDAIASYDPLHAEITRQYLQPREMRFASLDDVLTQDTARRATYPEMRWQLRNPSDQREIVGEVAACDHASLDACVRRANAAQTDWAALPAEARGAALEQAVTAIEQRRQQLTDAIVRDIGKPLAEARAEVERAIELARLAIAYFCVERPWERCAPQVFARRTPLGTVAAITPFNHALGIPLGKLFPALALGNAAIWKPAIAGSGVASLTFEALLSAGLPKNLLGLIQGDAATALHLARHGGIDAVSITASETAGRQLALACASNFKPLQAELGGNNAVVVLPDADLAGIAGDLARAAFGFAGQRCTAGRRILIARERRDELVEALLAAIHHLRVGHPAQPETEVGPLISRLQQQRVDKLVARSVADGARLLCGGRVPPGLEHGCWIAPALLQCDNPDNAIFQEETFGPVATITPFKDLEEAIHLVNAVPQGLIATLYGGDHADQTRFLAGVRAGVVKFNCLPSGVHAEAPFGGWKNSGFGPPEHGPWDADFYSRVQAIYGLPATPTL